MTRASSGGGTAVAERPGSTPPVDPRLRARRIAVRRREGRRRLRRLLFAVVVTIVCAMAWAITRSPLLDIDHLEVVGVERLDAATVVATGGVAIDDPLIDLDLGAVDDRIEALAWVESVEVTRSWWGTIRFAVTERVPVAILVGDGTDAGSWLVDRSGWVLASATPDDRSSLAMIEGVEAPEVGGRLDAEHRPPVSVAASLTVGLHPWIDAVVVDPSGEHWLRLARSASDPSQGHDPAPGGDPVSDPARVRLGRTLDLPEQLVAAETVLTRVDLSCLATVDVRVAATPAVTRHPDCEAM
ncbi:MAG: FtsQ-type POTRA domain-containing protein [Acidimicrobiales bacterium]|nr:FtsQ-type POTRA domain-containing protein [Acidimicrobiales bacterium]